MTRAPRPSARGLTLVELLLASAVTSMVALAVASMMTSISAVSIGDRESRSALLRAHAAREALRAYLEPTLAVVQVSPDGASVVLWIEDDASPGMANLLELRLLRYDAAQERIVAERVELPVGWHPVTKLQTNAIIGASTDAFAAFASMRSMGLTREVTLASGVSSVAWSFSDATARNATRARVELGIEPTDPAFESPTVVLAAYGLPNHRSPAR